MDNRLPLVTVGGEGGDVEDAAVAQSICTSSAVVTSFRQMGQNFSSLMTVVKHSMHPTCTHGVITGLSGDWKQMGHSMRPFCTPESNIVGSVTC